MAAIASAAMLSCLFSLTFFNTLRFTLIHCVSHSILLGFDFSGRSWRFDGFPKRKSWTTSFLSRSYRRQGIHVVGSSTAPSYGNDSEVPESEIRSSRYIWPGDSKRPRVCILGGGFGGLYTALRLESLEWPDGKKPQVVLVDHSERFVFKPLLYELISGEVDEWEIAPRFSDLLSKTSVQFFKDRVQSLRPSDHLGIDGPALSQSAGVVHLDSGLLIEYDWLVIALGAETKVDFVPGAHENAIPFSTLEDAQKVNQRLRELERKCFGTESRIQVAVVGCGYSGVELAATIAERLKDAGAVVAINAEKSILPNAPSGNRESAIKVLASRNVQLLLGYYVTRIRSNAELPSSSSLHGKTENYDVAKLVLELQPTEKKLQSQVVEADLVLWTVGSKSQLPELNKVGVSGFLPFNGRGQVETDETLRVKGHPRTFALGDSSALRDRNGNLLPATAQVAFQQADFAAWNIWAAINDRPLLPFRFQNLGEMMSLGRYDGAITPSFIEGLTLEGPIGHTARKIVYLIRLPTDEHRFKVGLSWLAKTAVDSTALLQNALTEILSGK